jgi:3-hydroxyisobutyrate dehydrogenase/glyoxylate/succinic semialdehyde reductase
MNIGFIGLGIMGSRMAKNLLKAGHRLVVYNRTQAKAEPLLAQGAIWAESPAALAEQVEVLITMLSTPEAVQAAALGNEGFLDHLAEGAIWVDCTTVNPSFSRHMAAQAAERQVRFLDAPVAGSKSPAEKGELLFLVGGDAGDVEAYQGLFEAMGRGVVHLGNQGMGTSLKMVFNSLLGQAMLVFSEAMTMGQALGLGEEQLLETLVGSPVVPPFIAGKRPKIETSDYEADFPLQWMRKDLQLASQTAYEAGGGAPAVNAAKEVYALAVQNGWGERDFSAIYQFLNDQG